MSKYPGEEETTYSVDDIIAEFKATEMSGLDAMDLAEMKDEAQNRRLQEEQQPKGNGQKTAQTSVGGQKTPQNAASEEEETQTGAEKQAAPDKTEEKTPRVQPEPDEAAPRSRFRIIENEQFKKEKEEQSRLAEQERQMQAERQEKPPSAKQSRKAETRQESAQEEFSSGETGEEPEEAAPEEGAAQGRRFLFWKKEPDAANRWGNEEDYGEYGEEEEEEEPLKEDFLFEPDPEDIPHNINRLGKKIRRVTVRAIWQLVLLGLSVLLMQLPNIPNLPIPEKLTYASAPQLYLMLRCCLLAASLLCASDILAAGLYRLAHIRPTLDSLVTITAAAAMAHSLAIALKPPAQVFDYGYVAQLVLFAALVGKRCRLLMLRRTYKAAILSNSPVHIRLEELEKENILYKVQGTMDTDLSVISRSDMTQRIGAIYAPIAIAAVLALAVMASFAKKQPGNFLPALAAISSVAAPVGLLLSTTSPGSRISKKLFTSGTAMLSYDAARQMQKANKAALTDSDLFPQGSVAISGMKVGKNQTLEKVVATAAAVLGRVGGGIGFAFNDFAKQQYIFVPEPASIEYYESGGMSAKIGSDEVLCGTAGFLTRMGIHVTEGLTIKSGVFIAINGAFAGVFALKYQAQPQGLSGFSVLKTGRLKPVLATRDFNLIPPMIESKFGLRSGNVTMPDIETRLRLSGGAAAETESPSLALLSRNTMLTFCDCITAARRFCSAVHFNVACSAAAGIIGMLLMFYLSSTNNYAAGCPYNALLYLLLWYLPVWLKSFISSRY